MYKKPYVKQMLNECRRHFHYPQVLPLSQQAFVLENLVGEWRNDATSVEQFVHIVWVVQNFQSLSIFSGLRNQYSNEFLSKFASLWNKRKPYLHPMDQFDRRSMQRILDPSLFLQLINRLPLLGVREARDYTYDTRQRQGAFSAF